ncbi:MAG: DEAD/DEAH box helicase, partial [Sciscionella sp.]
MLPSLVAEDLRAGLTSFLGTTFALGDDDVRAELERFVADPEHGVFRGPFVRLQLPFRPADGEWRAHLDWAPRGLWPHRHQAQAWVRLASRDRIPRPTLVTTGTGSGKTESFLVPVLDHCQRHVGRLGIKALVLYPMNALANDQARRLAHLIHEHHDQLGGVTAGLYTGDSDSAVEMTETSVIGDKHAMRRNPPDILLTNYKMLDMLLLRSEDTPLFAGAGESLQYLVLDEFHTYDGAQGTDVAMLLRRLGMALGVTTDERPLGAITPVATSATLGGGTEGGPALREFAETVFGAEFDATSLIGEERLTIEEWAAAPQGRTPLLDEVTAALSDCTSHEAQLAEGKRLFLGNAGLDDEALAELLRAHPLTRTLLQLTTVPRSLADLAQDVEPSWATTTDERCATARHAVALYLALLSRARTADGRPLLGVDVQLWVREVSRLLRRLSSSPRFSWHDGAATEDETRSLPSIYCRHCGRSGWGVAARPGGSLDSNPTSVWAKTVTDPATSRAWIFAPGEAAQGSIEVRWVDADAVEYAPAATTRPGTRVPVLVTSDAQAARDGQCPACGLKDGIRYLGSRVATLASVTLGQLFGSPDIAAAEKKTLVFTDSVQDAS